MNHKQLSRFNSKVKSDDIVYILGDCILGDSEQSIKYLNALHGYKYIILGNHDTPNRVALYQGLPRTEVLGYATVVKFGKKSFYLSHYPTRVGNFEEKHGIRCLHGHTHSKDRFEYFEDRCYNVNVDAHDCYPVNLQDLVKDIQNHTEEVKNDKK